LRGALQNILLAPHLFSKWIIRFYIDESVPSEFVSLMQSLGAQIVTHTGVHSRRQNYVGVFWLPTTLLWGVLWCVMLIRFSVSGKYWQLKSGWHRLHGFMLFVIGGHIQIWSLPVYGAV
jgi:hypothetical protein